jgi:hypothetical protein
MAEKISIEIDATVEDIQKMLSTIRDKKTKKDDVKPRIEEKKDPDERQILLG